MRSLSDVQRALEVDGDPRILNALRHGWRGIFDDLSDEWKQSLRLDKRVVIDALITRHELSFVLMRYEHAYKGRPDIFVRAAFAISACLGGDRP